MVRVLAAVLFCLYKKALLVCVVCTCVNKPLPPPPPPPPPPPLSRMFPRKVWAQRQPKWSQFVRLFTRVVVGHILRLLPLCWKWNIRTFDNVHPLTVVYDIKIIKSSVPQIMIRTLPKPSPVMKNLSLWTFDVFKLEYGPTKSSHRSTYSKTRIFIYFTFGSITNYWLDISKKCYKAKCLVSIGAQKTYLDHLQFF